MGFSYYKKLVYEALSASEIARDDDKYLYFIVCASIAQDYDFEVHKLTFEDVMCEEIYPAPETISRIRRKLQNEFPELAGGRRRERMERQADFIQFAKESSDDRLGGSDIGTNTRCM